MFRSKDLYNRYVYDSYGKELGKIKDIIIDYINSKVSGFLVLNSKGNNYIKRIDAKDFIEKNYSEFNEYTGEDLFSEVKTMEVRDYVGIEKGMVNDIILDEESFEIKAFVLQKEKMGIELEENEIILSKNVVFADKYIQYLGDSNIIFKNINNTVYKN